MAETRMVLPRSGTADWTWHWLRDGAGKLFVAQFRSEADLGTPGLARWFFSPRDPGVWALDLSRRGWGYLETVEHPRASSGSILGSWRLPDRRDVDKWRLIVSEQIGPAMALNHKGQWYFGNGQTIHTTATMTAELVHEFALPNELLTGLDGDEGVCDERLADLLPA